MAEGKTKGWMWKQGYKVKNWKYRYFVMHNTYLEYFEVDQRDAQALGSIPLGMVVCYVPFKNETDRPFSFALQTPDRTFYLSTESEDDMKLWVDAIKRSIQDIFVHQVNHHLPSIPAFSDPPSTPLKEQDGFRGLTRSISKKFTKKDKETKQEKEIDITNPTSSVSTLSSPNRAPSPSPSSVTPPVTVPTLSPPVPISPNNSPPSTSPRAVTMNEKKDTKAEKKDAMKEKAPTPTPNPTPASTSTPPAPTSTPAPTPTPHKPFTVSRTAPVVPIRSEAPSPPSASSSSPSSPSFPPPRPERVSKPKGLVRPPRPHVKPLPSVPESSSSSSSSTSPSLPPDTILSKSPPSTTKPTLSPRPGPTSRPLSPGPNSRPLSPGKQEIRTTTSETNTHITNGNSTTYNIQSVDNLVINNNIVIHCPDAPTKEKVEESLAVKNKERMLGSSVPLTGEVVSTTKRNNFTVYQVELKWAEHTWTIYRRFKQFDEVDGYLANVLHPEFTLPSKTLKHNFKSAFVEKRREALDQYIKGCCQRLEQIMVTRKARKHFFKFIKPAQLGDLRGAQFSFDIFATPDEKVFMAQ